MNSHFTWKICNMCCNSHEYIPFEISDLTSKMNSMHRTKPNMCVHVLPFRISALERFQQQERAEEIRQAAVCIVCQCFKAD